MERALKCDICSENFLSQSNFDYHIASQHGNPAVLMKKRVECNVCGKIFNHNSHLIRHMTVHTGERPFKCTVTDCKTEFKRQSYLKDHMKYKHSDARPHECNFSDCLFTAKSSKLLIQHKIKHNVDRPFACESEGCNYRTKHKNALQRHLKSVHSTTKTAACSECGFKTTRQDHLKRHMRRHQSFREDNSKCSHPECVEYLICSHDLECLQTNQNEESSIQCNQSSREQRFSDAHTLRELYMDVNSGQSLEFPNLDYSYRTSPADDLHNLEGENQENIEPNGIQTHPSLAKDEEYSHLPDVRPARDESEQEIVAGHFTKLKLVKEAAKNGVRNNIRLVGFDN